TESQHAAQSNVDQSNTGIQQLDPGNGRKQRWNRHRYEDETRNPGSSGNRGSFEQPGKNDRQRKSDGKGPKGKQQCVQEQRQGRRTTKDQGVIGQGCGGGFEGWCLFTAL